MKRRILLVAGLAATQLALVAVGVAPQLSARMLGETYLIRTLPVDPIDPFRGAYVHLTYPGLERDVANGDGGTVYVPLVPDTKASAVLDVELVKAGEWQTERPASGPYLRCASTGWNLECGIDSLFASQERAREIETEMAGRSGIATLKVDGRGNAAVVDVRVS